MRSRGWRNIQYHGSSKSDALYLRDGHLRYAGPTAELTLIGIDPIDSTSLPLRVWLYLFPYNSTSTSLHDFERVRVDALRLLEPFDCNSCHRLAFLNEHRSLRLANKPDRISSNVLCVHLFQPQLHFMKLTLMQPTGLLHQSRRDGPL